METSIDNQQQLSNTDFAEYYPQSQSERRRLIESPLSRLTRNWDPNGKILIPGYGLGGTMIDLFFVRLHNYFGIDLNFHALQKGISDQGIFDPRVAQANIEKMPFTKSTFDYAVVSDVIQDFSSFDKLVANLTAIKSLIKDKGQIIIINPTAESYTVETETFNCAGFGNENAVKKGMGAEVKGVLKGKINTIGYQNDQEKQLPFVDHVWKEKDLEKAFKIVGLKKLAKEKPKAKGTIRTDHDWISETKTAPWVIYLLEVNNKS